MMINILSIDLEDYYQVSAFESVVKRTEWEKYESRIERNTHRLLDILDEAGRGHGAESRGEGSQSVSRRHASSSSLLHAPCSMPSAQGSFNLQPPSTLEPPPTSNLQPQTVSPLPPTLPTATFFCLGWIAERYPALIREIRNRGYEIASHGYDHRLVYEMGPEAFREDIRKSKKILENIIGEEVEGYRAPSYSITKKSLWAFLILAEEGYRYDSSIFPIHHDRYGMPNAPRFPFWVDFNNGSSPKFVPSSDSLLHALCSMPYAQGSSNLQPPTSNFLLEFPMSTLRIFGQNAPISGGGYFRLLPYVIVEKTLRRINKKDKRPFIFYLHPWELDVEQPRIEGSGVLSQFRHRVNLKQTEGKLRKLLQEFTFSSIKDFISHSDVALR